MSLNLIIDVVQACLIIWLIIDAHNSKDEKYGKMVP